MQPNISLLAPLQESMVPTPSVASPVAGRVCLGCGCLFVSKLASRMYCTKRCSKNAQQRRSRLKTAIYVEYNCPYCGKSGERRKIKTGKVATCGERKCVDAHKIKVRAESRLRWKLDNGPQWSKEYNKTYRKDACLCGCLKSVNKPTCINCARVIRDAIKAINNENRGYYGQLICAQCGIVYERTAKHQVCCSRKCRYKRKQDLYKKSGVLAEWTKAHRKKAKATDPLYTVKRSVRTRLREAMFGFRKNGTTFENLGYTPDQLREHLESLFVFGMGWHNYGTEWHIDHIKPVSHHVFKAAKDVYRCWKLSNLQPRYATNDIAAKYGSFHEGNIEKGDRYVG